MTTYASSQRSDVALIVKQSTPGTKTAMLASIKVGGDLHEQPTSDQLQTIKSATDRWVANHTELM
jgi:hypothetical protein